MVSGHTKCSNSLQIDLKALDLQWFFDILRPLPTSPFVLPNPPSGRKGNSTSFIPSTEGFLREKIHPHS